MTVIAWDGKTLAADRRFSSGSTILERTKIFRHKDELIGFHGTASCGVELVKWYTDGAYPAAFPHHVRDIKEVTAGLVVIGADGTPREYDGCAVPFHLEGKHIAWGSGQEGALVAMHLGCSAAEAVEVVSKFNRGCGNGVDKLELA